MGAYAGVPRPVSGSQVRLWDGRWWPCAGRYARVPVFRYGWAPSGLATTRQLAAEGLRPGGQDVAAYLAWGPANRPRWAYLYRRDLAAEKRPMTPARWVAVEAMNAALRVCPSCGIDDGYRIPRSLGECVVCHDPTNDITDAVVAYIRKTYQQEEEVA